MDNQFTNSARLSALGYVYQIFSYSLYLAMRNPSNKYREIFIERFDDIEISEGGKTTESIQIKHVEKNLTNRSSDLWKTLRAWSENYQQGCIHLPDAILTIVTTAKAPDGSIASFLQLDGRDTEKACRLLVAETKKPTDSLETQFSAFNNLNHDQQRRLVNAIYIQDESLNIDQIPQKIKDSFYGVQPENIDDLYEKLTGWWLNQVITHLRNESKEPIFTSKVFSKIADINDRLKERIIPDLFFNASPPDDYDWDSRTFVTQMKLINLPENTRFKAIRDQYRASKLRTWLVDEAHLTDLEEYDQELIEDWELIFQSSLSTSELPALTDESAQKTGREIYFKVQERRTPILQQLSKGYITRGSFHILADKKIDPIVGWHPNFKTLLVPKKEA